MRYPLEVAGTPSCISETKKDRVKWQKMFIPELMSSEESGGEQAKYIVIRPLTWRASRVDKFFKSLDDAAQGKMSAQSQHQKKEKRIGEPSAHPKPTGELPAWACTDV